MSDENQIEDATRKTRCLYRQPTLKSEETPQQFLVLGDSPALDCVIITTCPICLEVQSTKTVQLKGLLRSCKVQI